MGGGPAIGEGGSSLPLPPPLPPRKDQDSIGTQSSRFTQQDRNVSPYSRKGTRSRPSGGRRGASPGYNTENRGGVGGGGELVISLLISLLISSPPPRTPQEHFGNPISTPNMGRLQRTAGIAAPGGEPPPGGAPGGAGPPQQLLHPPLQGRRGFPIPPPHVLPVIAQVKPEGEAGHAAILDQR